MDWIKRIITKKQVSIGSGKATETTRPDPQTQSEKIKSDHTHSDKIKSKPVELENATESSKPKTDSETKSANHLQSEIEELPPVDAFVEVKAAPDKMSATVILHAPQHGGADVVPEMVIGALLAQNISYGINQTLIAQKATRHGYEQPFIAASGTPPKDGENGKIIEKVDRVKQLSFEENAHGNVDYKNLNLINQVEEGTVLCEIVAPTDPIPGKNIYGEEVYGRPGVAPTIPQGDNTVLTENGTKLIASKSGNLIYRNNRFSVQVVLEVPENVDMSTGNIHFSGDVLVRGAVFEGFEIIAGGNVVVYGIVEGVHISAGGSIQLKQGINGMGRGLIEAKGDITCRYLENCTARAGGSVYAETIIHSKVYSGASIIVSGSRSSIIGGLCSALNTIEVKTIGSRMNTLTTILLGATNEMIEERRNLALEIESYQKQLHQFSLDFDFLKQRIAAGQLNERHRALLLKIQEELPVVRKKLDESTAKAEELEGIISNNLHCRLTCQHIYPPTKISIGNDTIYVPEDRNRCIIYYADGEIKFSYN